MKNILFGVTVTLALLLAGCSGDKAEAPEQAAPAADAAMEAAPMEEMAPAMGATIDHSQDEQEFMLRRTIGGLERMIEQYKADGYDSAELETSLSQAQADLATLTGG